MSVEAVKEWCLARVGEGYIYGAKGQTCSPAFRQQQAAQYPAQSEKILGVGAKWDGKPVWDCAQLTRFAAKQGGVTLVSGATSQWKKTDWAESGTIDGIPSEKVGFLYRESNGSMQHTGIYLGDGTFVHAKGTAYGVLHQSMSEYNWTHYAIPYWDEEGSVEPMEVLFTAEVNVSSVNVRKSPSTASDKLAVFKQGAKVSVVEEGTDWYGIEYNGGKAYIMSKFLKKESSDDCVERFRDVLLNLRAELDATIDCTLDALGG